MCPPPPVYYVRCREEGEGDTQLMSIHVLSGNFRRREEARGRRQTRTKQFSSHRNTFNVETRTGDLKMYTCNLPLYGTYAITHATATKKTFNDHVQKICPPSFSIPAAPLPSPPFPGAEYLGQEPQAASSSLASLSPFHLSSFPPLLFITCVTG